MIHTSKKNLKDDQEEIKDKRKKRILNSKPKKINIF